MENHFAEQRSLHTQAKTFADTLNRVAFVMVFTLDMQGKPDYGVHALSNEAEQRGLTDDNFMEVLHNEFGEG